MSIVESLLSRRTKKVIINFPTAGAMWEFFESSDLKEFRLDSSRCSVAGRFHAIEIERARNEMKAVIEEVCAN
jgi:hypothetical protein